VDPVVPAEDLSPGLAVAMEIDPTGLSAIEAYRLMIACVVPRPIAWVSTLDPAGKPNLAPFSYFGGVSSSPPVVMVSVGWSHGRRKDTATNLLSLPEAVVHVPSRPLAERMVRSSARTPPGADDFALVGLERLPSVRVRPWRIAGAPVAMEAVVLRHLALEEGPSDVFLLRVVRYHLDETVLVEGIPDPERLLAVGRLGGDGYCDTASPFRIARPK
jgi:flavin reductase (DIM6/NTAB) family NADH-FMN oxidoreductase RutF